MWRFLLYFSFLAAEAKNTIVYDTYYGTVLTKAQIAERIKTNTTFWCTAEVKVPCDPNEGRRVDGSCNNLALPPRGAAHTPFLKVLPQDFGKGYGPRLDQSGQPLPLARPLRASLLSTGTRPDLTFTQLATHFLVFVASDITTVQDTINYVLWKTYCCQPKGKTDPDCVPQKVPVDDPVHRFSEVRCLNLTRPITYQSLGCVNDGSLPDKITSATPALDLSTVYGKSNEVIIQKGRLLKGGLLKYEVVDGRVFPPKVTTGSGFCYLNAPPRETRCHDTPEVGANSLLGINLCTVWFWRNHNRIARSLARLNPCWNDEKLFNTAREINIATFVQIFLYELLAVLLGYDNLVYDSVLSPNPGFRDVYDNSSFPQISSEFPYALRWVHLMQDGRLKMYDEAGYYVKQIPIVNVTLRTGYLAIDKNMDYITQGCFRQPCGKLDYTIDPEIANNILGGLQRSSDVGTSDLAKGRYYGFPPYVEYRKFCGGKTIESFDDLADVISVENLELLKEAYTGVRDIELMAGLWLEKLIDGAYVPPTFYCLVAEQMVRSVASDRHWYERPNRPNAFTLRQLKEIRKASVSRLLCDVGDKVTQIQRSGFLRAGPKNKIDSCKKLPTIDLSAWKDNSCASGQ